MARCGEGWRTMKSGKHADHDNEISSIKIRGFQSAAEIDHGNRRPRRDGTGVIAVYTWAFTRLNSEYQDARINLPSTHYTHPKNPTLQSGVSRDEHIFSGLDRKESESAFRVSLGGLSDPIASDREQPNGNALQRQRDRIDDLTRDALRTDDQREQQCNTQPFHDR